MKFDRVLPLLVMAGCALVVVDASAEDQRDDPQLVEATKKVIQAIERESRTSARSARLSGDELSAMYVRAAARAAMPLPPALENKAFLLGLAIACEDTGMLAKIPGEAAFVEALDDRESRKRRIATLGTPTVHGRHDLWLHFIVSSYLSARLGSEAAEAAGLAKELADTQRSSGFSFTDLAADMAGLAFSNAVSSGSVTLEQIEKEFSVAMFVPAIGGLRDGLSLADVFVKSGQPQPLYTQTLGDIRTRISGLAVYRENLSVAGGPLQPEEVAIIAVRDSATSQEVAEYYAESRGIPPSHICLIDVVPGKDLERDEWESSIRPAIRNWILQRNLETKIRCLATVWDVPLKIGKRSGDTEYRVAFLRADRQLRAQLVSEQVGKIRTLLADKDVSNVIEVDPDDSTETFRSLLQTELAAAQQRIKSATPADRASANTRLLQTLTALGGLQAVAAVMAEQKADTPAAQQGITQQLEFAKGRLMGLREAIRALTEMPDTVERDEQVVSIVIVAEGAIGAMGWLDSQLELLKKNETYSSFDSELSLLFWLDYPLLRWQPNLLHYRYDGSPLRQRRHTLMVSRLEAPTVELTKKLIDNAIAVEQQGLAGKMYLDARGLAGEPSKNSPGSYASFDQALRDLDTVLRERSKQPVVLDNKPELFQDGDCPETSLYCGWYSLAKYVDAFDFKPGSVGYHMASGEAATLRNADSQVWCKRMLEDGICATLGPVHEPYLVAFPRPDEFFITLMSGEYSLVESYYRTKPFNSWVMVLVGDPLYNPFRGRPALHPAELPENLQTVIAAPTNL